MHSFPSSACHFLQGQGVVGGEAAAQVEPMCKAPREEISPGEEAQLADAEQKGWNRALREQRVCASPCPGEG